MDQDDIVDVTDTGVAELDRTQHDTAELVEELLIEEISIDGMCGVY
jgi:mycofactocin precursor